MEGTWVGLVLFLIALGAAGFFIWQREALKKDRPTKK